jgi:hypothetical protein
VRPWSHLLVSVTSRAQYRRPDQPQLLCLVTDALDRPEHKHARRRGVHPCRSGLAGTARDRPDTRQPADRHTE